MLTCICSNCNTRIDVGEDTYCSVCFEDLQDQISKLQEQLADLESDNIILKAEIAELENKEST